MIHPKISCAVVVVVTLTGFQSAALAGTITNAPPTGALAYFHESETAGGTFFADDIILQTVTLYLSSGIDPGAANLRAVVLATDGSDAPTGSPIWESEVFTAPAGEPLTAVTFIVNLPTTPGDYYFVGVDSGYITTTPTNGDTYLVGTTVDNILGTYWDLNSNVSGAWQQHLDTDVAAGVVLSDVPFVPTPAALPLGMIGLGVIAARRRRRAA